MRPRDLPAARDALAATCALDPTGSAFGWEHRTLTSDPRLVYVTEAMTELVLDVASSIPDDTRIIDLRFPAATGMVVFAHPIEGTDALSGGDVRVSGIVWGPINVKTNNGGDQGIAIASVLSATSPSPSGGTERTRRAVATARSNGSPSLTSPLAPPGRTRQRRQRQRVDPPLVGRSVLAVAAVRTEPFRTATHVGVGTCQRPRGPAVRPQGTGLAVGETTGLLVVAATVRAQLASFDSPPAESGMVADHHPSRSVSPDRHPGLTAVVAADLGDDLDHWPVQLLGWCARALRWANTSATMAVTANRSTGSSRFMVSWAASPQARSTATDSSVGVQPVRSAWASASSRTRRSTAGVILRLDAMGAHVTRPVSVVVGILDGQQAEVLLLAHTHASRLGSPCRTSNRSKGDQR